MCIMDYHLGMIHMSCVSHNKTAQQDLQSIAMKLFNIPESPGMCIKVIYHLMKVHFIYL